MGSELKTLTVHPAVNGCLTSWGRFMVAKEKDWAQPFKLCCSPGHDVALIILMH